MVMSYIKMKLSVSQYKGSTFQINVYENIIADTYIILVHVHVKCVVCDIRLSVIEDVFFLFIKGMVIAYQNETIIHA